MVGLVQGVPLEIEAAPRLVDDNALSSFPWWQEPAGLLARFSELRKYSAPCDWYRVVDGFLGVDSADLTVRQRFRTLYAELASVGPSPLEASQQLQCRIQIVEDLPAHLVTFTTTAELSIIDFILALFPGRGYVEMKGASPGWRSLGLDGRTRPVLTVRGSQVLVDAHEPWQVLIANCAVNWVMQMQRGLLFFHAAAVAIAGQGVLLAGEKGSGKSTLSMALASHGHDFFGDEIAAVRTEVFELAPFRRAVSVRKGPQAPEVEKKLQGKNCFTETFPDGSVRIRAAASDLFPESGARPQRVRQVFFLRGFDQSPRAEAFHPRPADLRLLAPLACTFWGSSGAARLAQVAKLLSSVKCHFLFAGQPEDTAILVERIVRSA